MLDITTYRPLAGGDLRAKSLSSLARRRFSHDWPSRLAKLCDSLQSAGHMYLQVGIRSVRLTGSMSIQQRDTMIDAFTNDPDVTVFLMSLKAGGVALNLTAASHVFLMSPWWNPAGEQIDFALMHARL